MYRRRIRSTLTGCGLGLLAMTLAPGFAQAHGNHPHQDPPSDEQNKRIIGGDAERTPNGLYRMRLKDGTQMYTHGVDAVDAAAPSGPAFEPGAPERSPKCSNTTNYFHILYGRPAAAADRYAQVKQEIQAVIRRSNAVLNSEAIASGGTGLDYKVLCDVTGQIAVSSFVNTSGTDTFAGMINAAKSAGYTRTDVNYVMFYDLDAPGAAGVGHMMLDDKLALDNWNNRGGRYSAIWAPYWTSHTPMHEMGHNLGAVQPAAPDSTGSGLHCNDEWDIMCYAPDGGDRNQTIIDVCGDYDHFDCSYDSYFDAAPEAGEWLSNHWNVGSRFVRFTAVGPGDDLYADMRHSDGTTVLGTGMFWHSIPTSAPTLTTCASGEEYVEALDRYDDPGSSEYGIQARIYDQGVTRDGDPNNDRYWTVKDVGTATGGKGWCVNIPEGHDVMLSVWEVFPDGTLHDRVDRLGKS